MVILTAGNKKYKDLVLSLERSVKYHGNDIIIYDVDELGLGEKFEVPPPIDSRQIRRYKPRYMLKCLEWCIERGLQFAWLDADMVVRRPLDRLENLPGWPFDIAMPIKKAKDGTFKFKSSAVFVNPTPGAERLLKAWRDEIPKNGRGDQRYFKQFVFQHVPSSWESVKRKNNIILPQGVVGLLHDDYNYEIREDSQLDKLPHWARIIQFSGMGGPNKFKDKMRFMKRYWR